MKDANTLRLLRTLSQAEAGAIVTVSIPICLVGTHPHPLVETHPGASYACSLKENSYSLDLRTLQRASLQKRQSESLQSDSATKELSVLLIDDDRIQLDLTAAVLRQSGIDSTTCLQTDELLDALRNRHYDLLLTDVQMPAINGFYLLTRLHSSNPDWVKRENRGQGLSPARHVQSIITERLRKCSIVRAVSSLFSQQRQRF